MNQRNMELPETQKDTTEQPEIVLHDEFIGVARWHNAILVEIWGRLQLRHVGAVDDLYRTLTRAYPGTIVQIPIFRMGTPMPDSNTRTEARGLAKRMMANVKRAIVLEGSNLWATAFRAFIRTVSTLLRLPMRPFADVESAAHFLASDIRPASGRTVEPRDFIAAIRFTRDEFARRRAQPK